MAGPSNTRRRKRAGGPPTERVPRSRPDARLEPLRPGKKGAYGPPAKRPLAAVAEHAAAEAAAVQEHAVQAATEVATEAAAVATDAVGVAQHAVEAATEVATDAAHRGQALEQEVVEAAGAVAAQATKVSRAAKRAGRGSAERALHAAGSAVAFVAQEAEDASGFLDSLGELFATLGGLAGDAYGVVKTWVGGVLGWVEAELPTLRGTVAPAARIEALLERLDRAGWWLDEAVRIPGTSWKVGVDALLSFVPGVGSVAGGLVQGWLVLEALRSGVSARVAGQMLGNVVLDALLGGVPIVGFFFDLWFKATRRNLALLRAAHGR